MIKLGAYSVLASLKPGHLSVTRPWFSQISASLSSVSFNYTSYCLNCGSNSDLQFTFSTHMRVNNFDEFLPREWVGLYTDWFIRKYVSK